jgi:DNA-binding NtrC family response regulator
MRPLHLFLFDDQIADDFRKNIKEIEVMSGEESPISVVFAEEGAPGASGDFPNPTVVVTTFMDGLEAYHELAQHSGYDVILLDNAWDEAPEGEHLEGGVVRAETFGVDFLLPTARKNNREAFIAIVTAKGSGKRRSLLKVAVNHGVNMWFEKPLPYDSLSATILLALQPMLHQQTRRRLEIPLWLERRRELNSRHDALHGYIGNSEKTVLLLEFLEQCATVSDGPVLLLGESGTGKSELARLFHSMDPKRRDAPFIEVHIGNTPETMIDDKLFGHEKGAFTGATTQLRGPFEMAEDGMVFLDEIGDVPLGIQEKLLRVLREGVVERLGGTKPTHVRTRIVAATNKDLQVMVREGEFREDLWYRLDVLRCSLPPLRERAEDISDIANSLLCPFKKRMHLDFGFSDECLEKMRRYSWPGNVGQLKGKLERACVFAALHKRKVLSWQDFELGPDPSVIPTTTSPAQGASREDEFDAKQVQAATELLQHLITNPETIPSIKKRYARENGLEQVPKLTLLIFLRDFGHLPKGGRPSPMDEKCRLVFECNYAALRRHLRELFGEVSDAERIAAALG